MHDPTYPLTVRDRVWVYGWIAAGCAVWAVVLGGCAIKWNPLGGILGGTSTPKVPPPDTGNPFWFLTWIAGGLALFGAIALVASFVIPLIPRKAAVASIACAVAFGIAKSFMDKFLGAMLWGAMGILVVGGLFALWPWLMAARNWSLNRTGYKMAQNGNKEGGIALMAAARGLTKFSEKHREKRHALAEKFGWSKPVEHVPV